MARNVSQKLIHAHLVDGQMTPGKEIGLRIDQTLTQDATGTLALLEFEALGIPRVRTELSAQYIDHNILQTDHRNQEDHLFLRSACERFGLWLSPAGSGVSHPVHQERFGIPGKTLLGSDSHTPAAGAIGMFAVGAGGLEVAMAMAGEPFFVAMPEIWGIRLVGQLPDWVSAKDIILELLRRHSVKGAMNCVLEYYGPGVDQLSVMDRHVIANMGTELGATTSVFPSDDRVGAFLARFGREHHWQRIIADASASYDRHEEIDLAQLEPLIAMPSSPDNVVSVREVAGREIAQAYIGSSANPGYCDFAVAAEIVKGRHVHPRVSFDVNPTSRRLLLELIRDGHITSLIEAGGRLHQAGCNGCIGMGQAPARDRLSLRTVPRNFPGRSGSQDDAVALVSPETAAASALRGKVTDPRDLGITYPRRVEPSARPPEDALLVAPLSPDRAGLVELLKGDNIVSLPTLEPLPDELSGPVMLKVGDNISTDEIMPAGARVLPYRSNIPRIADFVFAAVDASYSQRAIKRRESGGHFLLAGENYGQRSSREHAALAPRYLGLRAVFANSFARIHRQNLLNFGILPLILAESEEWSRVGQGDVLCLPRIREQLAAGEEIVVDRPSGGRSLRARHDLSPRQLSIVLAGGLINYFRSTRIAARPIGEAHGDSEISIPCR
jgi:aconitate hydratase